jgi:hypothetical protein
MLVLLLSAGCQLRPGPDAPLQARRFEIKDVAKSDIDLVAEVTVRQSLAYLRALALKLYQRNPAQLRRGGYRGDVHSVVARLMGTPSPAMRAPWRGHSGGALITLGLSPAYAGDRVAALIYGLRGMLAAAYGGEGPFYLAHEYDPQKIYYLARNIEIAAWRLRHARDPRGRLLLLSTGVDTQGMINASYERLTGKLIALQDHFARVVADSSNRRIKNVIQGLASAVFFPI